MMPARPSGACVGRDYRFWIALGAALPVWAALCLGLRPAFDFAWPARAPWLFVQLALLYPVLEEIVFRGFVQGVAQRRLRNIFRGPISLANVVTSVLFTALHFLYHPPLWAIAVFIPSLVFGYFKDRYGSLLPPMVLHVYYNTGYYWLCETDFANP